jgi:monofunctional biosynthetic peptidoglycan transglycosylase
VVAAEDGRFCSHNGIDFDAVGDAMADYEERGRLRGASTISMQVARNVFLWTGGGVVRKAIEAPLALALDALWPKRRVMEVYFNIAEWGPGIFGAEAAAQHYFHKPAAALSSFEAARLAAILPNPLRWSAAQPTAYIEHRAGVIQTRMLQLNRTQTACLK